MVPRHLRRPARQHGAGIRYRDRDDLVLLELPPARPPPRPSPATPSARRRVTARAHLASGAPRYLLINAGNANAGTGAAAWPTPRPAAPRWPRRRLPPGAGVALLHRCHRRVPAGGAHRRGSCRTLLAGLAEDGWEAAARAIMTTDTVPKLASRRSTRRSRGHVVGMAKGAGMIRPDMATMLAFVATDAAVPAEVAGRLLRRAVAGSFNSISIDGDTSTNDACVLCAAGTLPGNARRAGSDAAAALYEAIARVCAELATAIVARRRGRDQAGHHRGHGGGERRRGAAGRRHHRPLAAGQDRAVRLRSELGPHPRRRRSRRRGRRWTSSGCASGSTTA
jgi:glutamate N-acetyltransferase/amino-acid N-acetyltransferase